MAAHEFTHQWWGNQLKPANALGALLLTESITEYITLQIYREHYGEEKANQFLTAQSRRYWQGSLSESNGEPPLYLAKPSQQYLTYSKGALALHALQQTIGDTTLRQILFSFLNKHRFAGPPYPTTIQLIEHIKQNVPDSIHGMVDDWFYRHTYLENRN